MERYIALCSVTWALRQHKAHARITAMAVATPGAAATGSLWAQWEGNPRVYWNYPPSPKPLHPIKLLGLDPVGSPTGRIVEYKPEFHPTPLTGVSKTLRELACASVTASFITGVDYTALEARVLAHYIKDRDMKMTLEHQERLRALLKPRDTAAMRKLYRERDKSIFKVDEIQDVDRRYRWDMFWGDMRPWTPDPAHIETRRALYDEFAMYLNDDHIDTALRSIVPPL